MLLTLYFMVATWMQTWRLNRVYAQLARLLGQQQQQQQSTSIAFFAAAPDEVKGTAASPAVGEPASKTGDEDPTGNISRSRTPLLAALIWHKHYTTLLISIVLLPSKY